MSEKAENGPEDKGQSSKADNETEGQNQELTIITRETSVDQTFITPEGAKAKSASIEEAFTAINLRLPITREQSPEEQKTALEKLAYALVLECLKDLDKDLTPEIILDRLVQRGLPKAITGLLSPELLKLTSNTRHDLVTAARRTRGRKPVIEEIGTELTAFFEENHERIIRAFEAMESPNESLKIIAEVFAALDAGSFTDQDLHRAFKALHKLKSEGEEKLTRPITQIALEYIREKGVEAEIKSDTLIKIKDSNESPRRKQRGINCRLHPHLNPLPSDALGARRDCREPSQQSCGVLNPKRE